MELRGAGALVTGGASGIGAATVRLLQQAGARVAVLDRTSAPDADWFASCDVANESDVVDGIAAAAAHLGRLELAVVCAGVGGQGAFLDLTTDEWDRVMNVNLRGAFVSMRESARAMVPNKTGAIIAITSVSGSLTERTMGHYSTSKAGLNALVRVAARELGPHGVRVNAVAPGVTVTPMLAPTERLPGYRERVAERAALERLGTADDIAQAVLGVLAMDWVTGQVIIADGGLSLASPLDPADHLPRRADDARER